MRAFVLTFLYLSHTRLKFRDVMKLIMIQVRVDIPLNTLPFGHSYCPLGISIHQFHYIYTFDLVHPNQFILLFFSTLIC